MTAEKFEDFYSLLGVSQSSTREEIRRAFRARMREWHPDVNPSLNATAHTQRIIAAYKILDDSEARNRYDTEYFKHLVRSSRRTPSQPPDSRPEAHRAETPDSSAGYMDPVLERWIRTARKEAAAEWRQFASELRGASMAALGGAARVFLMMVIFALIGLLLLNIL